MGIKERWQDWKYRQRAKFASSFPNLAWQNFAQTMDVQKTYNAHQALELPPVRQAIKLLGSGMSALPIRVEDAVGNDGTWTSTAITDSEVRLLTGAWESEVLAGDAIRMMTESVLLYGFAAVYILKDARGQYQSLVVLPPEHISRVIEGGRVQIVIGHDQLLTGDIPRRPPMEDLIWIEPDRPLRRNAQPLSVFAECWPTIRMGIAAHRWGGDYYDRGATPTTYITKVSPGPAPKDGKPQRKIWLAGDRMRRENRPDMLLPPGYDVKAVGSNPQQAMLDEVMRIVIRAISQVTSIPPLLLQDLERSTLTNYPTALRYFSRFTLQSMARMWQEQITYKLWPGGTRRLRFDVSDIGDETKLETAQRVGMLVKDGVATQNEARHVVGLEAVNPEDEDDNANKLIRSPSIPFIIDTQEPIDVIDEEN